MRIKDLYTIKPLGYKEAMSIVVDKHYMHRVAPCSYAFALYEKLTGAVLGVVTYGASASTTLRRGICGDSEKDNVLELTRLWLHDALPKNGESFLISNTIKLLPKEIIVSFADSSVGHVGYVYQASNFIYTGLSAKFKDPKVRGLEHQHHTSFAHGMTNKEIIEKWGNRVYFVERPRKHRYVYFNCNSKRRQELFAKLKYKILPYPKGGLGIEYLQTES